MPLNYDKSRLGSESLKCNQKIDQTVPLLTNVWFPEMVSLDAIWLSFSPDGVVVVVVVESWPGKKDGPAIPSGLLIMTKP